MDSLAEPWWPLGLAVMKRIDDLLRYGICLKYFNIAMIIPQCSQNYRGSEPQPPTHFFLRILGFFTGRR
uniref:Uncharacterized protein n=1 Tax=Prolemur simus TaxID=1328070 RepID=A0A8C8ZYR5_PROSS